MWGKVIFYDIHNSTTTQLFLKTFIRMEKTMVEKNSTGYLRMPPEFIERKDWKLLSADNNTVKATMRHPGLSFRDFDKNGKPKLWELMSLCSSTRIFIHHAKMNESGETFRDFQELTKNHMTFLITGQLKFFKPLYDLSNINEPMLVKVKGGYIGNTSLNAHTSVCLESSDEEIMTNVNQVVYIDPNTRKPSALPEWWKTKYAESARGMPSLKIDKFERPPNIGCQRFQVTWTFTDAYNHANWTSYARYAIDCAHLCSKKGTLKHFEENYKNGLSCVQLHYYGEALEGEFLDVYAWEDPEDTKKLYFDINKNGNSIFQCIMFFF